MSLLPGIGAGDQGGAASFYPYSIDHSLRFDHKSTSDYLNRMMGSQGNRKTHTLSFWIKRCQLVNINGGLQTVLDAGNASNNYSRYIFTHTGTDQFEISSKASGTTQYDLVTALTFHDTAAWYHFVITFDTTQGTDSKRIKVYINGVLQTGFSESVYPSQNSNTIVNSSIAHYFGRASWTGAFWLDAYLADVNFVDGHALAPESFGETKSGAWIPVNYANKISEISRTDGTVFGELTGQGGNSAAFDGTLFKTYANSAATSSNAASAYIGKDWGTGVRHTVTGFALSSNTDYGFVGSTASTFTVRLYGSNLPVGYGGTLLFTSSAVTDANNRGTIKYFSDTTINSEETVSNFDTTTEYRYHWITITPNTTESIHISQVQFYELGSSTYEGTNSFRLQFGNTSNFGTDTGGQFNNYVVGGSGLAAQDQMLDTPTNNYSVWQRYFGGGEKTPSSYDIAIDGLQEGNLKVSLGVNKYIGNTFRPVSGKWYAEIRVTTIGSTNGEIDWGWLQANEYAGTTGHAGQANKWGAYYHAYSTAHIRLYDETSQLGSNINLTISAGDILQLAWDIDNGKGWIGIDNTWYRTNASDGNPSAGTNEAFTFTAEEAKNLQVYIANGTDTDVHVANFGQDGTFAGAVTAQNNADANGQGNFYYAPPTDFLALCSSNLPDTALAPNQDTQGNGNHNAILYTGNQTARSETGVGFAPDLVWIKSRNATWANNWFDTVRGPNKVINSDWEPQASTSEERSISDGLNSFDSDGFSLGGASTLESRNTNNSGSTYIAWCWKAGGTPTATNSGGQNPTSGSVMIDGSASTAALASATKYPDKMSVNTTAGFSIVSYTGNNNTSCTIPHGLNTAPSMVIIKNRSASPNGQWVIGNDQNGFTGQMYFTNGVFSTNSGSFNNTAPSNTVVTVGTDNTVTEGTDDFIMYCFSNVEGYQKIGSYVGDGDGGDGRFVFTGFRPAFILFKATDSAVTWNVFDNRRTSINGFVSGTSGRLRLLPAQYNNEISTNFLHILSNGFMMRSSSSAVNGLGTNYLYYAIADAQPFKFANAV